jgi:hypothetical protein
MPDATPNKQLVNDVTQDEDRGKLIGKVCDHARDRGDGICQWNIGTDVAGVQVVLSIDACINRSSTPPPATGSTFRGTNDK